jgi:hypothetical protein
LPGVGYLKRLINSEARDPHDPIGIIDHNRHPIAVVSAHCSIYEQVLQFLPPAQPGRVKSIARPAISYGQNPVAQVPANNGDMPPSIDGPGVSRPGFADNDFGRHHAAGFDQLHLSRDRQRIPEKVRRSLVACGRPTC